MSQVHVYYSRQADVEGGAARALAVNFLEWLDGQGYSVIPGEEAKRRFEANGEASYAELSHAWWESLADEDEHRQIHYRES